MTLKELYEKALEVTPLVESVGLNSRYPAEQGYETRFSAFLEDQCAIGWTVEEMLEDLRQIARALEREKINA